MTAEGVSVERLCAELGAAAPASWPPLYNDEGTRTWFLQKLEAEPAAAGWLGYYVVADIEGVPTLVGAGGYKGPPNGDGIVEIGYSIIDAYHRRGIATAVVNELVARAFADARVKRVTAETPATFTASRGLLEKCGFTLIGARADPDDGELALYVRTLTP
ncbi:MAG: GNAT family N-acetyltransferase [Phycisphaerales bacterium]|nr:GNAT family N-acetyltransferase [Phycisphaerales bacterium]